mmetsp:Transcript_3470/g.6680  ORF Transcript_3470/g.6680 Transcript_3470/m.6680 type:complete len:356 (+) Transcript_3470:211-1278(+)
MLGSGRDGRPRSAKSQFLARQMDHREVQKDGDREFVMYLEHIDRYRNSDLPKHTRIRIDQWVEKMCEPMSSREWKKNRNAYAVLLLDQLEYGELSEPFIKVPDSGPLGTLPSYMRRRSRPKSPATYRVPLSPKPRYRHQEPRRSSPAARRSSPAARPKSPHFKPQYRPHNPFAEQSYAVSRRDSDDYTQHPRRMKTPERNTNKRYGSHFDDRVESELLQDKLAGALEKIDAQQHHIDLLEAELANERAIRAREKERLRELHRTEIDEMRKVHMKEIDMLNAARVESDTFHIHSNFNVEAKHTSTGALLHDDGDDDPYRELEMSASSDKHHPFVADDDGFLQYLDEFEERARLMLG